MFILRVDEVLHLEAGSEREILVGEFYDTQSGWLNLYTLGTLDTEDMFASAGGDVHWLGRELFHE